MPGSPAAKTGEITPGDRIVAIDGNPCDAWLFAELQLSQKKEGEEIVLTLSRDGQQKDVKVAKTEVAWPLDLQPENKELVLGVETLYALGRPAQIPIDGRLGYAASFMLRSTGDALKRTVATLGGLFTGKVSVDQGLGGPVLIAQITARVADRGIAEFFGWMAVLSVSLGLINLLPIPVLDGGTIMFLAIEGIRRKPVSMRLRMIATYIGLAFIVVLMVIVFRNDLNRCGPGMMLGLWP